MADGCVTEVRRSSSISPADPEMAAATLTDMSKRTSRAKANVRRKKANHGRKPNLGRNS